MNAMAYQNTSPTIVYSTVYSGADKRKHQCYVSLAFVRGIHQWPVNSQHKCPVTRKMVPFDDVIMRQFSHHDDVVSRKGFEHHFSLVWTSCWTKSRVTWDLICHPIARPYERAMECLLWALCLDKVLAFFLSYCIQYSVIFDSGMWGVRPGYIWYFQICYKIYFEIVQDFHM